MVDFLKQLRERKLQLKRELADIEIAERLFRQLSDGEKSEQTYLPLIMPSVTETQPKTIKKMVVKLLQETWPQGYTARELLENIRVRWNAGLERTSLSPQLTRLKNDGEIINEHNVWKLNRDGQGDNEPSNETEPPVGTSGSETSGPGFV